MSRRSPLVFVLLSPLFWLLFSLPVSAAGLTLSPAFQEIRVNSSDSAQPSLPQPNLPSQASVKFSNQTDTSANLSFSLVKIIATDLLGRLQFNAPLPQTAYPAAADLGRIEPSQVTLNPNDSAAVTVAFDPAKLRPGTNAFLLLAHVQNPEPNPSTGDRGTAIDQNLAATILVNAVGGDSVDLQLVAADLFTLPLRFTLPDFVTLTVKNDGNSRSVPRGLARVTDVFGRELMRGAVNTQSAVVLPGSQRVIYAALAPTHRSWPVIWARFQLTAYDETHQSNFSLTRPFLYFNPWLALIVPVLLLLKFIFRRRLSR